MTKQPEVYPPVFHAVPRSGTAENEHWPQTHSSKNSHFEFIKSENHATMKSPSDNRRSTTGAAHPSSAADLTVATANAMPSNPMGIEHAPYSDASPLPPAQILAQYEVVNGSSERKRSVKLENAPYDDEAPLTPAQVASSFEDDKGSATKRKYQTGYREADDLHHDDNTQRQNIATSNNESTEVQQANQEQNDTMCHFHASTDAQEEMHGESAPTSGQDHTDMFIRPQPRSTLISHQNNQPRVPILEATLVEEARQEETVYDAVAVRTEDAVPEHSFWKRYQKYIFLCLGSLVIGGIVTALGIFVRLRNEDDEANHSLSPYPPSPMYYADKDKKRCANEGHTSNFRQRSYASVHECCVTEWTLQYNDCIKNSLPIHTGDDPSWTNTTSTYPTPTIANYQTTSPSQTNMSVIGDISTSLWKQRGQTIIGEAAGDQAGWSVALSSNGKTLAVGSPFSDFGHGRVRVYGSNGLSWTQLGSDIKNDGNYDYSALGSSVALSSDGRTLAIGAPTGRNSNDVTSGHVKIYQRVGDDLHWKQLGQVIGGNQMLDMFGHSLCISSDGKAVAIGAPGPANNDDRQGYVKVYHMGDDAVAPSWRQLGQDIEGEAVGDLFGWSVDLASSPEGLTLAVGAPYNDSNNGEHSGNVRIYHMKHVTIGAGPSWEKLGSDIVGQEAGDQAGTAVSISSDGKTVAIGSNAHEMITGHVRVYHFEGSIEGNLTTGSSWLQVGEDIDGEDVGDMSGRSVALSALGDIVAIGAPFNGDGSEQAGHVRVYEMNITENESNWRQLGQDIDGEGWFGFSLALSAEGKTLAVGAPENDGNGDKSGLAQILYR